MTKIENLHVFAEDEPRLSVLHAACLVWTRQDYNFFALGSSPSDAASLRDCCGIEARVIRDFVDRVDAGKIALNDKSLLVFDECFLNADSDSKRPALFSGLLVLLVAAGGRVVLLKEVAMDSRLSAIFSVIDGVNAVYCQ